MCMIQQDAIESHKIKKLQSMITRLYKQYFGDNSQPICIWLTIPDGQAYIAGKPSTASTVQIPVADNLPNDKRHEFMRAVCLQWQDISSCNKNEIILTCPGQEDAKAHFSVASERIDKPKRKITNIKLLVKMTFSYFIKGYLSTSINL